MTSRPYLRRPWRLAYPHPVLGLGVASLKAGEVIAVVTALIAKNMPPGPPHSSCSPREGGGEC